MIDIDKQVEKYLSYFDDPHNLELAFYGGSFTGLKNSLIEEYLKVGYKYIEKGIVSTMRVSTRPDYINKAKLDLLKKYGVETIELGVQSMNNEILDANKRGTSKNRIIKASEDIKKSGFNLGLQMMTGLYKSSKEDDIETALEIARLSPDFVRIYPTMVLPDIELYDLYREGKYKVSTTDQMLDTVTRIVAIFESLDIEIIRIGLYSGGDERDYERIGPFHPALRQIVYSRLYKSFLTSILNDFNEKDIRLGAPGKDLSYLVGYKASNKNFLLDKGYKVKFIEEKLDPLTISVSSPSRSSIYNLRDYLKERISDLYEIKKDNTTRL